MFCRLPAGAADFLVTFLLRFLRRLFQVDLPDTDIADMFSPTLITLSFDTPAFAEDTPAHFAASFLR